MLLAMRRNVLDTEPSAIFALAEGEFRNPDPGSKDTCSALRSGSTSTRPTRRQLGVQVEPQRKQPYNPQRGASLELSNTRPTSAQKDQWKTRSAVSTT